MARVEWSDSQKQAWSFVEYAQGEGYNQTEALRQYRAGGGHIRTADWGQLWNVYDTGYDQWSEVYGLAGNDLVPADAFTDVDINYRDRYTYRFRGTIKDEYGNIQTGIYRQFSSDRRLTVTEVNQRAAEEYYGDPSTPAQEVYEINEFEFFERSG